MDLDRLLELNNSYNDSHNNVVTLLQYILEKGELTESDLNELEDMYNKNEDNYNNLNTSEQEIIKGDTEEKIDELDKTKVPLDVDSVLDLLTNGGRNTFIYKDSEGNINISIKAKNISLEGLVTANSNFKVLLDGSIEAVNGKFSGSINAESGTISSDLEVQGLNVSGDLTADTLTVNKINCSNILTTIESNMSITVDSSSTSITDTLGDGAVYSSLQKLLNDLPKNLNGYTITITVNNELSELIQIVGFSGGELRILFNEQVNGYIYTASNTAKVLLKGRGITTQVLIYNYKLTGNLNMREEDDASATLVQTLPSGAQVLVTEISSNNWGYTTYNGLSGWISLNTSYITKEEVYETTGTSTAIIPGVLLKDGTHQSSIYIDNCSYVSINGLDIYSKTENECYAIKGYRNSFIYLKDVRCIGAENGVVAQLGTRIYTSNMQGKVNTVADKALMGSTIYIEDGNNINGTIVNDSTSQIVYDSSSLVQDSTSDVGENTNTSTSTTTVTINSNSGDTYRSTVYNNWKKDNTARQGDYGYGDCNGCWFFGTQFTSKLKGKTITKLNISVTRQAGGISGDRTATLKMHSYSSRPSGSPSYISGWSKDFTIGIGDTKTITITDSTVLDAIKDGTCIGFGVHGTYDRTHYIVFSGSCTITATIQG